MEISASKKFLQSSDENHPIIGLRHMRYITKSINKLNAGNEYLVLFVYEGNSISWIFKTIEERDSVFSLIKEEI